jgi:hypothetical protein
MDSPVVFGHLSRASRARAEHLIHDVRALGECWPSPDELAKDGARASKALSADRRR